MDAESFPLMKNRGKCKSSYMSNGKQNRIGDKAALAKGSGEEKVSLQVDLYSLKREWLIWNTYL